MTGWYWMWWLGQRSKLWKSIGILPLGDEQPKPSWVRMKCHGKLLRWSPLEHFQLFHTSSIWSFKDSKLILLLSRSRNTSPNHLRLLHLIKQASMSSESRTITVLPCIFRVGSKRKCGASSIHSFTVHLRWNLCCSSYPKPSKVPQVAFPQQSQLNLTLQVAKDDMLQQALLGIASKNAAKGCHYGKGRHVWMQHLSAYADHLFVDAGPSLCIPNLFEVPLDCQSNTSQIRFNWIASQNVPFNE